MNRRQFGLSGVPLLVGMASDAQAQIKTGDAARASTILRVGARRDIQTLGEAARLAPAGSVIEVDAGNYEGDVAVWERDQLQLRAVGGRVRLRAAGLAAEGKAIWVVRSNQMSVQGFDFEGCAVPSRNGAGIRFERGWLTVRDCTFTRNEMGLLTGNDGSASLDIENCEFAYNMRPDGHNHNLYVGAIGRLRISGSYLHHAHIGHLLKSRAAMNQIFYNRLTDEAGGTASYELEFPNGGIAQVMGNIIEQGAQTDNPFLISFGAEGYRRPRNALYLVHNTLVNGFQTGQFLRVAPHGAQILAVNNLLVGPGELETAGPGDLRNNLHAIAGDFADLAQRDLRLKASSALTGRVVAFDPIDGVSLAPVREYAHPRSSRRIRPSKHNPGAMQSLA